MGNKYIIHKIQFIIVHNFKNGNNLNVHLQKTDKTNYAIITPLLFYIYIYTAEIDQQTNYIKDDVTEYYFKKMVFSTNDMITGHSQEKKRLIISQ